MVSAVNSTLLTSSLTTLEESKHQDSDSNTRYKRLKKTTSRDWLKHAKLAINMPANSPNILIKAKILVDLPLLPTCQLHAA